MPDLGNNSCELCEAPDTRAMVACDNCELWFHFACVGVTADVKDRDWKCQKCTKLATTGGPPLKPSVGGSLTSQNPDDRNTTGEQIENKTEGSKPNPEQPHTNPGKGQSKSTSSRSSSQRRVKLQLAKLEEEKQMEKKFIEMKYKILEQDISSSSECDDEQVTSQPDPKVSEWLSTQSDSRPKIPSKGDSKNKPKSAISEKMSQSQTQALKSDAAVYQFHSINTAQNASSQLRQRNSGAPANISALPQIREMYPSEHLNHQYNLPQNAGENYCNPNLAPDNALLLDNVNLTRQHIAARQAIPKELPCFSGKPEEWPLFISAFEGSTRTCGFSLDENLIRLQRALKGKALEAVRSRLMLPTCVPAVIETLRQLFGKPECIIHTLLGQIRNAPSIKADRLDTIVDLSLSVQNLCAVIDATNMQAYRVNPCLLEELVQKLPAHMKLNWAMHKMCIENPDVTTFNNWLAQLARAASDVSYMLTTPQSNHQNNTKADKSKKEKEKGFLNTHNTSTQSNLGSSSNPDDQVNTKEKRCCICEGICVQVSECQKFVNSSHNDKWDYVRKYFLCRKCLQSHGSQRCRNQKICNIDGCSYKHNRLLHKSKSADISRNTQASTSETSNIVATQFEHENQAEILFRIVPVTISSKHATISTFAFLDDGSSITLLEDEIANALHLTGTPKPLCLKWTSDTHRMENESRKVSLTISSATNPRKVFAVPVAHTVKKLNLPTQTLSAEYLQSRFQHLRGIPLASYNQAIPRILIGLDNAKLGLTLNFKEGKHHEPVAAKTRLGWTVYGSMQNNVIDALNPRGSFTICKCQHEQDDSLHQAVKYYFSSENIGVQKMERKLESVQEKRAREIQERTTKLVGDRYETGLLWRTDDIKLPESYRMALKRLEALERRLLKDNDLRQTMNKHIRDYITKGYARKLRDDEIKTPHDRKWYLPIFPVKNQNKPGKFRIVWDAAAESRGTSLNSALLTGPDQLTSLLAVLWRFRQKQFGMCGDIREMFHQVLVRDKDIHSQRFLWRETPTSGTPDEYVMLVMTFGATCSPSSAQFVKNTNALAFVETHPRAVEAIIDNHYVDDYLDSVESEDEAIVLANSVQMIHQKGGFEIRNWISNSQKVMTSMNVMCEKNKKSLDLSPAHEFEKVLGMWWCTANDCFMFIISRNVKSAEILQRDRHPTKRELLRVLMTIFDPMGLLANFLIHLKILLQKIWRAGLSWDEEIPESLFEKWLMWLDDLPKVEKLQIPRWYSLKLSDEVELHIFVDASEDATAAVAYFRSSSNNEINVSIIASKTRVAPIRQQSIPRLELEAATLGARLSHTITKQHTIAITRRYLWTDSKTVIAWLRSENMRFKQYVSFRVGEILELTNLCEWRWLSGKLNVADVATKWSNTPDLSCDSVWFKGPKFLYRGSDEWPDNINIYETTEELRPHYHHTVKVLGRLVNYEQFSNWRKLQRAMGYGIRFINNFKASLTCTKNKYRSISGPLTQAELRDAHDYLIRLVQQESYADELAILKRNATLPKYEQLSIDKSSPIAKDSPYLDERGIIRAYGRIDASPDVSFQTKRPILLSRNHYITHLILHSYHLKWHHHNNATQLNEIRQVYSIPRLRGQLKTVTRNCQECKISRAIPKPPQMASIPPARLATFTRPFSFIGIDYFGPINVKVGRRSEKRWGVLITCLTIRAIHIEISHSLSTDSCLMCLRNFIARRGTPNEIYSDCGTNFKGATRELQEAISDIDQSSLATAFTTENTKWLFNPPASPHMGGSWERLVRSVKTTLQKITPTRNPSDELLRSMLMEVENVVNSRPLTYVPLDSEDDEALTPNHFILGSSSGCKPVGKFDDSEILLKRNWMVSQQFTNHFWKRWIREYLPTLTRRTKWLKPSKPLEVGEIVIIVDETLPRNVWPKGRVIEVMKSKDGQVRRAKVKTSHGTYERPAVKLAVLDVNYKPTSVDSTRERTGTSLDESNIVSNEEYLKKSPAVPDESKTLFTTPVAALPESIPSDVSHLK